MAEDVRWQQRFGNYCRALEQLEVFLEPPALNEREQQGLIKAFEYVFELAPPLPGKLTPLYSDHQAPSARKVDASLFRSPGGLMEQSNASLQRGRQG